MHESSSESVDLVESWHAGTSFCKVQSRRPWRDGSLFSKYRLACWQTCRRYRCKRNNLNDDHANNHTSSRGVPVGPTSDRSGPQPQRGVCAVARSRFQGGGEKFLLPPPRILDGQDANAQRAALRELAGSDQAVEELLSPVGDGPYIIKVRDVKTSGGLIRAVDLWFVVYSDLKQADLGPRSRSYRPERSRGGQYVVPDSAPQTRRTPTRSELSPRPRRPTRKAGTPTSTPACSVASTSR